MKTFVTAFAVSLGLALAAPVLAQDNARPSDLPEICRTGAGAAMGGAMGGQNMNMGGGMSGMGNMDQAHGDMAMGMDRMHADMMMGMQAEDIDVAFACSMLPHHMGAITMAKAELAHGDDPQMKEMAQMIIDAQEKEIAELKDWLSKQGK